MNKLLVSDIIELDTGSYELDCQNNDLEITINGEVTIYLIDAILERLKINFKEHSKLTVYNYREKNIQNMEVEIWQDNNSEIIFNSTSITKNDNEIVIHNYINGNNNISNLNVRNISSNGLAKIIIDVVVKNGTKNNIALEDLKGINDGGLVHIEPNIEAYSNEVIANHLTTIGGIDKDVQNYLLSKGISEEFSKKILIKSFILGNMDDYIKELIGGE